MSGLNFEQIVAQIESSHVGDPERDGFQLLSALLQSNQDRLSDFPAGTLVVGTNGKGSFCATLTQILKDQNKRVGTFTSPHLQSICERIQINGEPVSKDLFVKTYNFCQTFDGVENLGRFELLTLMAVSLFSGAVGEPPVEQMIFEAGIGGRKDATRAIPYQQVVVTKLGLDHTEILGPTLIEIEREKLAVVHSGLSLPTIVFDNFVRAHRAQTVGPWTEFTYSVVPGLPPRSVLCVQGKSIGLGIPGVVGRDAALMCLRWVELRGLDFDKAVSSLEKVFWPGRQEFFALSDTNVLLSGDHNPQGIQSLIESLKQFRAGKIVVVLGVGIQKDMRGMIDCLVTEKFPIILTSTPFKGRTGSDLNKIQSNVHFRVVPNPQEALQLAREGMCERDLIVITGSLYLVGLLRSVILGTHI